MSSNPYYPPKASRQPAYDNPLHAPYSQSNQYPHSSSQVNVVNYDDNGAEHHYYHGPATNGGRNARTATAAPYHDPYATLTPGDDRPHPDLSTEYLMHDTSANLKDAGYPLSNEGYAMREQQYVLNKQGGRTRRMAEATDGLSPDTAPDMDRLNPEQKEIMKQFPKDLDDENGGKSGMQAAIAILKDWKHWFRLRYLHWWVMGIVVIAIVVLTTIYHTQIVNWLTPISKKVTTVAWGWVIPVAILFIISFPPLFGHEIVLILVGLVYGLWIGFGIAALGTLLGEIGNFYAFKYCLRSTAANYERKNVHYACMAEMVREGGFWVMFLARLSAIPGHFTTAVFATVGMNIFIFTLAAILALPKQLLIVYLGVAIKNSGAGQEDTKSKIIKYVVLVISFIITVWTAYWLYQKMEKVRPAVSAKLRQRRYELLLQARTPGTEGFVGTDQPYSYPPTSVQAGLGRGAGYHEGGSPPDLEHVKEPYYGYQQQSVPPRPRGVDEAYNGTPADDSFESFGPPAAMHSQSVRPAMGAPDKDGAAGPMSSTMTAVENDPGSQDTLRNPSNQAAKGGAAAIKAPYQFHRPIRADSQDPHSPTSPFQDPAGATTDGFPADSDLSQQQSSGGQFVDDRRYQQQYGPSASAYSSQRGANSRPPPALEPGQIADARTVPQGPAPVPALSAAAGGGRYNQPATYYDESDPLAAHQGDGSPSSSSITPSEGPPPEYASFPPSVHSHTLHQQPPRQHRGPYPETNQRQQQQQLQQQQPPNRVDPNVQRYHLSD